MKLIPILVIFAVLSLVFHVNDVWVNSSKVGSLLFTQAEAASDPVEGEAGDDGIDITLTDAEKKAKEEQEGKIYDEAPVPELLKGLSLLEDEADFDLDFARSELEVLQNLAQRREQLNEKEESLERKEAILEATEQQIEQKIAELTSLKSDLQGLLNQQSDEEQKRIKSLVRIYEGMKPKDAARILNTLEIDILISVMEQMSERRSAPILAEMDSERAREVTTLLAERKQLPNLDL